MYYARLKPSDSSPIVNAHIPEPAGELRYIVDLHDPGAIGDDRTVVHATLVGAV